MLPKQPLIENLELIAKQAVEGFIIGLHKSPFHGFSVEFAEHRLYNSGDPLKHIDWRVYGRTDKLFVKRFEEETNLRCCIVIDTSSSMQFPQNTERLTKLQFSCVAAAALMQVLRKQLDATALALFDEEISYLSECRSSQSHYRLLMHELEQLVNRRDLNNKTNAVNALHQVAEKMHKRSLVVVFSDMMDDSEHLDDLFEALQHLKFNKHEVILFHVTDGEHELDFNYENRPMEFVDMETGDSIKLQPEQIKDQYIKGVKEYVKQIEERCMQYRIDYTPVDLSKDVGQVLNSFLMKRNKLM